jgi:hypothetical protein
MVRAPKLEHVKAKVQTRGDVRAVGINYMSRLYAVVHHMHEVLRVRGEDTDLIQTSIRQYLIALAGHLETFFRDIFRFTLENDASFYDRTVQAHRLRLPAAKQLVEVGITGFDYVAETLTLQSASSIAEALDPFFLPNGFRSAVENTQLVYAVPSRSAIGRGFPLVMFPEWWEDLSQLFQLRHELIHDANSTSFIERHVIARLEALAVMLPQYVTLMVFSSGAQEAAEQEDRLPAMLLVEDFLAKDWQIVA